MKKTLVIFASSRSDGNTGKALEAVIAGRNLEVINLREKNISPYDYQNRNREDDFLELAEKMTKSDVIIFATPVYWYTMSAQLKTFFDRFTDLITIRKDLGRALKGKLCYVIATGADTALPPGFESPISATCAYLDMIYKGSLYCYVRKDGSFGPGALEKAEEFGKEVFG